MRELGTRELLSELRERGAVVFGTGFVANMLHEALASHGLWERVLCCAVSKPQGAADFFGVPVRPVDQIDPSRLVLVAVHEALLDDVGRILDGCGVTDWVWAYPHLYPLLYGEPVDRRRVPVRDLVRAQGSESFWLAVRELVLCDPAAGGAVYLKAQGLHCAPDTAAHRLEAFKELARSFDERGFDDASPLLVDGNLSVIDGLHRLVLAWHHGFFDVPCDIVAPSDAYRRLIGDDNRMTRDALEHAGLDSVEFAAVEQAQAELLSDAPLVSVVLPAYNVEGYLDQCMESIVAQTMGDFEAILVNDGSTDGTLARCRDWEARDPRVRVVDKPNGGVSSARNAGMDAAQGAWLAFVDPDDWVEPTYLADLLAGAACTGADRVECDLWRFDSRTGRETHRSCGGALGVPYTRVEQMRLGPTASYKAITRRDVWGRNGVRFPDCPYESPAVYALVVALARKLAWVPKPLYHYRRFRENSLVETAYASNGGSMRKPPGVEAVEELVAGFERCGLFDAYVDVLPGIVTYRLSDMLAMYHHRMEPEAFAKLVESYRDVVARLFGERRSAPYLVLGGYNLNRILLHADLLQNPAHRFNFSSIAAIASAPGAVAPITHKNRYRQQMLEREMDGTFWRVLADEQPGWVFIDLMEERHDLIEWQGRILTKSDALDGAEVDLPGARVIKRGSDEEAALFQTACERFADRLRATSPATRVVIIEDYLAERIGDAGGTVEHDDVEGIRVANRVIERCYNQLASSVPNAVRIDTRPCGRCFTDRAYEYGAVPSHLNELANRDIACLIAKELDL